jgi:predicted ATPase
VQSLFIHKGIKIGQLSFGEAAESINSEALSAGEKQMLSFISYNGLARNSIIFIDEPELSLHVDWQRSLFGILQRQQVSNQFIIATHSPFIYSKFPEKEILLDVDRGDAEIACG